MMSTVERGVPRPLSVKRHRSVRPARTGLTGLAALALAALLAATAVEVAGTSGHRAESVPEGSGGSGYLDPGQMFAINAVAGYQAVRAASVSGSDGTNTRTLSDGRAADNSVADPTGTTVDAVPTSFPDADSTGVPAGTTLRRSGSLTLSTPGQVISGLDITGCVNVTASNVVIRKSRITCAGRYSIRTIDADNLLVEDVEINGSGVNSAAVCCTGYTLRRVEIHNVIDGPRLGDDTTVEDSWIHHLKRVTGSHNDTLQTTGGVNITVRGNRLDAYNPTTNDPFNACLMIGSTTGPIVANLTYEQNYCNGGNYSIGVRADLNGDDIRLRANVYGRDHRYGVVARPQQDGITWEQSTNLWADTRTPVVP